MYSMNNTTCFSARFHYIARLIILSNRVFSDFAQHNFRNRFA